MIKINRNRYIKTIDFFKNNSTYFFVLKILYKWLPVVTFVAYPILLIYAWFWQNESFFKVLIVPASVFVFVSILRKLINEKRPYETYGVDSLFGKTTKGQSMPSRHTASAFIIAMSFLYVNFDIGITFLIVATMIMISRILAGVHYVRDVLVGAGISVLCGLIFFFLI